MAGGRIMCMEREFDAEGILLSLKEITSDRFQNHEVKKLDDFFFRDEEFVKKFASAVGGSDHHRYPGGLLKHTFNVTYWTIRLSEMYNCDNRDIVILAAKLHDIGKIYEYGDKTDSTLRGDMEGHIVIGISMIEEAFKNSRFDYSDDFRERIKGCIVQHHGEPCYGSPKSPNTQEAYILHHADYLDAIMYKVESVKNRTEKGAWSEYSETIKTRIYR